MAMVNSNGFQSSYNVGPLSDRPGSSSAGSALSSSVDADTASDPASSGFFMNDFKKHEDLKTMLDGNKDSSKLEAMKRIIGMIAKGRDASELFPAVVKNVVSKNIEVKKLVYVYLVRYAEEQQDLALLSISTFQRALKDPNQLIRASALRVLSSIRVPVIVPIMMLAIKEAVMDMSPYVRKTAAHAIPKLYSLDPEQKDILVEVIEKLLADKTTLVAGSAIQAFEEVCPERTDLIHKNYRKLCNLLVDVEEWGQVVIINMLTRYCRSQFISPNSDDVAHDKPFYGSDEDDDDNDGDSEKDSPKKKPYIMDPDHRLLLRTCRPLLNSRNAAVVMAVAQLYHHAAPRGEVTLVAKALIRLLRSHKEVQYIVLSNIASMSIKRKDLFEPFLKSFYVRSNDPLHTKLLKLEILTNLATETNISTILREFQTYVTSSDRDFAAATIQAIGRCASSIAEITDACLNGLVNLMSNKDEAVVAESVVVIKKLLQMQPTEHKEIIIHMAKLSDEITVSMARASIFWLIGEYSDRVPKIAPDVLRKAAKNFIQEEDIVKLQILNLAGKLCITNSKQTKLLCQYVFNLAKYDINYDIRDRSRFLRQLILPSEKGSYLAKHAKKIFLATKPAPVLESAFKDRDQFQLGTLSHLLNARTQGYQELADWPESAPDPSVRNVEVTMPWVTEVRTKSSKVTKSAAKKKSFYSESESSSGETSGADSTQSSSEEEGEEVDEDEDEEESSEPDSSSEEESNDDVVKPVKPVATKKSTTRKKGKTESNKSSSREEDTSEEESSEEDTSSADDDDDDDESTSESEEERKPVINKKTATKPSKSEALATCKPNADNLLLDLDDIFTPGTGNTPVLTPGSLLTPSMASDTSSYSILGDKMPTPAGSMLLSPQVEPQSYELLNRMTSGGLSATYSFTRAISVFSPKMASIELKFTNNSDKPFTSIKIGQKKLQSGIEMQEFPEIATLGTNASSSVLMAVDFNDTTQPANFEICSQERSFNVSIKAPVGELVQPHTMSEKDFNSQAAKLSGMNENSASVPLSESSHDQRTICNCVFEAANVLMVSSETDGEYRFAAKTLSSKSLVLVKVKRLDAKLSITVNCEKMVIGSMLVKDIKDSLSSA
ncbi:AP-3 complex subunit beta-2-like isoform X2 [Tubulanus polymorphus]|uniref:AP-3 complex subunit beta-2-like isoform X2 n=1 Tax=Tubulanus polymorphus TaxID=672921 RepID=UPI003DA37896